MSSVILRCGLMLYEVSKVISFLLFFVSNLNIDVFIQTNCLKGVGILFSPSFSLCASINLFCQQFFLFLLDGQFLIVKLSKFG